MFLPLVFRGNIFPAFIDGRSVFRVRFHVCGLNERLLLLIHWE
jgi:hypothetical protein